MTAESDFPLPQLTEGDVSFVGTAGRDEAPGPKSPADLAQLMDVPVTVAAVLGHVRMPVGELLRIGPGAVLELDRKVGEAIDILVNERLVARGEVVLVEDRLGITMTEIVRPAA
jgi:flagellar motor switch protein FliN/FliY